MPEPAVEITKKGGWEVAPNPAAAQAPSLGYVPCRTKATAWPQHRVKAGVCVQCGLPDSETIPPESLNDFRQARSKAASYFRACNT